MAIKMNDEEYNEYFERELEDRLTTERPTHMFIWDWDDKIQRKVHRTYNFNKVPHNEYEFSKKIRTNSADIIKKWMTDFGYHLCCLVKENIPHGYMEIACDPSPFRMDIDVKEQYRQC